MKSIADVIKHANFKFHWVYYDEIIWENDNWQQMFVFDFLYIKQSISKNRVKEKILDMTFLYKSVEVLTSARAYAIVIYVVFKKACSSNHGIFR